MPLLTPHGTLGYLHGEATELDRKLREGDGLIWRGDPDLSLSVGTLHAPKSGYDEKVGRYVVRGEVVARRYEVHRAAEDGRDYLIGHWPIEQFDMILTELVSMDMRSRAHTDVIDRIEAAEKAKEAAVASEMRDELGPMLDHAARLEHDRNNPRNVFRQVQGIRDESKASDVSSI